MHTMTIKVEDSVLHKFQQFIKISFPQNKVQIINDIVESDADRDEVITISNTSANSIDEWISEYDNDFNLIDDPYFYERKASLIKTRASIKNGSMKTEDFNTSIDKLIANYSA